jgi:TolB protein
VISPDGSRIAFTGQFTTMPEVYVVPVNGGQPVQVTNMGAAGQGARAPTWSPDGKRLAFSSGGDVHVTNVDGTGLRNLTDHPKQDVRPAWSPVAGKIAFVSNRDGTGDLYVMDEDGTGLERLTVDVVRRPAGDWSPMPAWSPDGRKIAFVSDRDGNREIYVINADGSGLTRLTHDPAEDSRPAWSPDGREIAFSRRVLGHYQIFIMNADGTEARRITSISSASFSAFPHWGPVPEPHD